MSNDAKKAPKDDEPLLNKNFKRNMLQAGIALLGIIVAVSIVFGIAHALSRPPQPQPGDTTTEQLQRIVRNEFNAHQINLQILMVFAAAGIGFFGIFVPVYVQRKKEEAHDRRMKGLEVEHRETKVELGKKHLDLDKKLKTAQELLNEQSTSTQKLSDDLKTAQDLISTQKIQIEKANKRLSKGLGQRAAEKKAEAIKTMISLKHFDADAQFHEGCEKCRPALEAGKDAYESQCYLEAVRHYYRAVEGCNNSEHKAAAYSNLSKGFWHLEDYPRALSAANSAINLDPDNSRHYYLRGVAFRERHKYTESIVALNEAIAKEEKAENRSERQAKYVSALAVALCGENRFSEASKKEDEAINFCQDAIKDATNLEEEINRTELLVKIYNSHVITHNYLAETVETPEEKAENAEHAARNRVRANDAEETVRRLEKMRQEKAAENQEQPEQGASEGATPPSPSAE